MLCGGDPITGIMAAVGIAATMASVTATGNPLGLLGLLGPLTAGLGSFAGPAASSLGTLAPTAGTAVPSNIASAASGAGLNAASAGLGAGSNALSLVPDLAVPTLTPELAAFGSSAISPVASSLPNIASSLPTPTTQAGATQPIRQPGPPPTSTPVSGQAPAMSSGNFNPNLQPVSSAKPSFSERAGNFLWGKPPDPNMFGNDPQGKMLAAIMQMQYENQKGTMQRSLLGGGLKGLASMTSGLLEDGEYKPDYTYTKKGTAKTPRQMQRMSALGPPSHTDLLKRIGFKGNA